MMFRSLCILMLAAAAVIGSTATAEEAAAPTLAQTLPARDVQMKNVDGQQLSLGALMGKQGTLVIFTCNACPFAKAWEQRIVQIGNSYSQKGIGVIAINSNDPGRVPDDGFEPMQKRAKERGLTFPYVMDETSGVARAFGATRTPEVFLYDGGAKLVYHGTIDDNYEQADKVQKPYLKEALDALLAGREIADKETKAVGCSIKFRS